MWAFWRWFKADKGRPTVALGASERRPVAVEPPESVGLQRLESRSHPGHFYYRNQMPAASRAYPCVHDNSLFTYEAVGESHYQDALERIVGGRRNEAVYFRAIAVLSSEPDNPHDPHAIVVRINGEPVA